MKKHLLAAALALTLTLTPALAAGVEEKFPAKNEYPGYADVPAGIWYEDGAKLCYEVGLIMGSDKGFEPERNMTVAEVAALAARVGEAVTGDTIVFLTAKPGQVVQWYQPYLDYLKQFGVTDVGNPDALATRHNFLSLLSAVLPQEFLAPINTIETLPDESGTMVLNFYNAGILTGLDKYGTYAAENPLSRQEGATMVARVARESLRKKFTPADYTPFRAAGVKPTDLFFEGYGKQVTAEAYLSSTLSVIGELERACAVKDIAFNWNNLELESGLTFKEYARQSILSDLQVSKTMATPLFETFDLQVFYSKYIDLNGVTV